MAVIKILYQGSPSLVSLIIIKLFQIKCVEGHSQCGGMKLHTKWGATKPCPRGDWPHANHCPRDDWIHGNVSNISAKQAYNRIPNVNVNI